MAILFRGHAAAIANIVALPAEAGQGDIAIVHTIGIAVIPSLATGYTGIATKDPTGAGGNGRIAYRILDGTEVDTGVWANADAIQVNVYRGVDPISPIGGQGEAAGSGTGQFLVPAIGVMTESDGTSWVTCYYGHGNASNANTKTLLGLTTRSSDHAPVNMFSGDTDGGVASWAQVNGTAVSGAANWHAFSVELVSRLGEPPASTPFTWEVVAGALPPGLALNAATGEITGTPTTAGRYEMTFQVYNNYWSSELWTCTMDVMGSFFAIESDPVAETWAFDFGKFLTRQKAIWHRHARVMTRPALIRGEHLYYVDDTLAVVRLDRVGSLSSSAYWTSPKLNRKKRNAEYNLRTVLLLYECAAEGDLVIEGSGDGGRTWISGLRNLNEVTESEGSIKRMTQGFDGIGGYDVRFRIRLPSDVLIRIQGWSAQLIEKGDLGKE